MLPDLYKALGIDKTADAATIKASHRKLVLKCHPDKVKDPELREEAAKQFYKIQQAYEILGDEEKRARYEAELRLARLREEKLQRAAASKDSKPPRPTYEARREYGLDRYDDERYARTSRSGYDDERYYYERASRTRYENDRREHVRSRSNRPSYEVPSNRSHKRASHESPKKFRSVDGESSSDDKETRIKREYERRRVDSIEALRKARARATASASAQSSESRRASEVKNIPKQSQPELRRKLQDKRAIKPSSPQGLQGVVGSIGRHKFTALSDTGASENCIRKQRVNDMKLKIRRLQPDEPTSFVMGNGRHMKVLGAVNCKWKFAADGNVVNITLYVVPDCIFDVILGADFLYNTETVTAKDYRLAPLDMPRNALGVRLVNLCGTPVRCMRGNLGSTECSALPDSGAEPNLVSYDYAEARGWLPDMYSPPESCRLLQFADGSTETVSGRLKLQWNFVTGWGPAESDGASYYEFDVLRGCPFEVILGCYFLNATKAFTDHTASMHEVMKDGASGMNIVVWVKAKLGKGTKSKTSVLPVNEDHQRQIREREAELERLAQVAWPSHTNQANGTQGTMQRPGDPGLPSHTQSNSVRGVDLEPPDIIQSLGTHGSVSGPIRPDTGSNMRSATESTLQDARSILNQSTSRSSAAPNLFTGSIAKSPTRSTTFRPSAVPVH